MRKLLKTIVLIALGALIIPVFGQVDNRLAATWQVQKYDLVVNLPQTDTDRAISVKATLTIKNISGKPARSLTLRISPNAEVATASINGSDIEFTKDADKIGAGTLQRIGIRVPSVEADAGITVAIDYKLTVSENTGLHSLSPAGSQFLPLSFWYPTPNSWYFSRGADYAPFTIRVNPKAGQTVVSSGAESAGVFDQKLNGQPFFAIGNWDRQEFSGVSVYIPKGAGTDEQKRASEVAAIAAEARSFVAEILGPPPAAPLKIAAVKRGAGFAGSGLIFVDEAAFRRSAIDAITAMSIADAVGKMWIGEKVTVMDDGFGVIREGLTRYIATQFLEKKFGAGAAEIERMRQRNAYAAVSRRDSPLNQVAPLDDYYFPAVANKGAMLWRLMAKKVGDAEFYNGVKAAGRDGEITLLKLRAAFPGHLEFFDHFTKQITETNLLVGLPQTGSGETKVALGNTGPIDVTVNVQAKLASGQSLSTPTTIRAKSFGDVSFRTAEKVIRVEIDPEKFYPQTDYSDDVAPREFDDSDLLLAVKRLFDKQDFSGAEKAARTVLGNFPNYDEVRVSLARSLLSQSKNADAEREFKAVLEEKLPTARSIAWANVGLGEVAARTGRNADAATFASAAIRADADFGASLAARQLRNRISAASAVEDDIKAFFTRFDQAAAANRKAEVEALVMPGEITRFVSSLSGQAAEWKSELRHIDRLTAETALVEASMTIRLLNREVETGMAVFRLSRAAGGWRLIGVDIFEVR